MRHPFLPAMLLFGASACAAVEADPAIPGCYEGPCVAIGEVQDLGAVRVTPDELLEDSRCPIEADCIWAGRVVLHVLVEPRGGNETTVIELESGKPQAIYNGTLELVEVAPDASGQWPDLAPGDYRFRFRYVPAIAEK